MNTDDDCIHCDRGTCGGRCQPEEDHSGEERDTMPPRSALSPAGDRGRCAEQMQGLGGTQLGCVLLHGHTGQHHDMTGADWIVRKEPTWEPMCQCGGPKNHCVGPR